jgi:CIC family chloride channel protein
LQEASLFNFVFKAILQLRERTLLYTARDPCGIYFTLLRKNFQKCRRKLHRAKNNVFTKALVSGVLLMVIYFVLPPLFGEGYDKVKLVANDSFTSFDDNTRLFSLLNDNWALVAFTACV